MTEAQESLKADIEKINDEATIEKIKILLWAFWHSRIWNSHVNRPNRTCDDFPIKLFEYIFKKKNHCKSRWQDNCKKFMYLGFE